MAPETSVSLDADGADGTASLQGSAGAAREPIPFTEVLDRRVVPPYGVTPLGAVSEEEKCVFVLKRNVNGQRGNNSYRCRYCAKDFKGGRQKIRTHILGEREGGTMIEPCPKPSTDAQKICMIQRGELIGKNKRTSFAVGNGKSVAHSSSSLPRGSTTSTSSAATVKDTRAPAPPAPPARPVPPPPLNDTNGPSGSRQTSIKGAWGRGHALKEVACIQIMKFLAVNKLSAAVISSKQFSDMLEAATAFTQTTGVRLTVPDRHEFGHGGKVLDAAVAHAREYKEGRLQEVRGLGNTFVADSFKKYKVSSNNSVLVTVRGEFFGGHANFTGVSKTGENLRDDAKRALLELGGEDIVFLVVMDGACKKTLRLIEREFPRMLTMRCATHGWGLLIGELLKLFPWEKALILKVVVFITNHTLVFDEMSKQVGGSTYL